MPRSLPDRCLPDSIREFRAAGRQRFQDGLALEAEGRRTAAIYLWGYAAEMILKAGYFGVIGFAEGQPITRADLRAAAVVAPTLGVPWPAPSRFHDLRAWSELLVAFRATSPGLAYPVPDFGLQVLSRGRQLQRRWSEILRYHKNVAYTYEVVQVREATGWLLAHARQL